MADATPVIKFRKTGNLWIDEMPVFDPTSLNPRLEQLAVKGTMRGLILNADNEIIGFRFAPQNGSGAVCKEIEVLSDFKYGEGGLVGRNAKLAKISGWHTGITLTKQIRDGKAVYYATKVDQHSTTSPISWYGKNNEGKWGHHQIKYDLLEDPLHEATKKVFHLVADRAASNIMGDIVGSFDKPEFNNRLRNIKLRDTDVEGHNYTLTLSELFARRYRASNLVAEAEPDQAGLRIPEAPPPYIQRYNDTEELAKQHKREYDDLFAAYKKNEQALDDQLMSEFDEHMGSNTPKKSFPEILSGRLSEPLKDPESGAVLTVEMPVLDAEGLPKLDRDGQIETKKVPVTHLTHNLLFDDDEQKFGSIDVKVEKKIEEMPDGPLKDQYKKICKSYNSKQAAETDKKIKAALRAPANAKQLREYLMNRTVMEAFSSEMASSVAGILKSNNDTLNSLLGPQINEKLKVDPNTRNFNYTTDNRDLVTVACEMMVAHDVLLPHTASDDSPIIPGLKPGAVASHTSLKLVKQYTDRILNEFQERAARSEGAEVLSRTDVAEDMKIPCDAVDKAMKELYGPLPENPVEAMQESMRRRVGAIDQKAAPEALVDVSNQMDRIRAVNNIPIKGDLDPVSAQTAWTGFLEGLTHGMKGLKELLEGIESGYSFGIGAS